MIFTWEDYNPETMGYVENRLDEYAVKMTGMDDGFRDNYEYWANEDYNTIGENFWCKVVFENETPFAVIQLGIYEGVVTVMETLVAPGKRGQGKGSMVIEELLHNAKSIIGIDVEKAEAVIFPSNTALQKAFEKAGFKYHHTHEDGDEVLQIYVASDNKKQDRPVKLLKGFKRVSVKAGESVTRSVTIELEDIKFYNTENGEWELDNSYTILAGTNSKNAKAVGRVKISD
ncbi:MAG: GNAT family N-acetyltransferase [Clostridia bacterium]|nr:GNAT family N-acetyltransferase [Clostridia bacterium]